jgi:hypothetical protein
MKRLLAVAFGLVFLTACHDSTQPVGQEPEVGRPNIAITNPEDSYGFVDEFFSFLKPLVDDPQVSGTTLNTNLMPVIELWLKSDVDLVALDPNGNHACTGLNGAQPLAEFTPQVDAEGTAYHYGWKTSEEPAGGLQDSTDYRLCVKITVAGPTGEVRQLVGWRDVRPEKSTSPNSPAGAPYLFENGRTIPIEFWLSSKSLCYDAVGNVIDCTIATFDYFGGTATCDDGKCGWFQPEGGIPMGELQTFEVRYVACSGYNDDGTVEYLDIANPQYEGCLEVTTYASYDWQAYSAFPAGAIAAACRDKSTLPSQDERLLLHLEAPDSKEVYALPTRPFELDCPGDPTSTVLDPDAPMGEKLMHYARRGVQAVLPWVAPPIAEAAHAGFGGGTDGGCRAPEAFGDGPQLATRETCSTPALSSGPQAQDEITPAGEPLTFRMVWALPSKIVARYNVTSLGPPLTTTDWMDPMTANTGQTLRPAVLVTDECEEDSGVDQDGNPIVEDCIGDPERPAVGAKVTFELSDGTTVVDITGTDGIAYQPWVLTAPGAFTTWAGGRGIGVDSSLASVTLSPPPAAGAYQDHIGNTSVRLVHPKVQFTAAVCSDKYDAIMGSSGVETSLYTQRYDVPINVSNSDADTAYLYVTSDCYHAYFALEIPEAADLENALRIVFVDSDSATGTLPPEWDAANPDAWFASTPEVGDDMWKIYQDLDRKSGTFGQWVVEDWNVSDDCTGSSKQSECGVLDDPENPAGDLLAPSGGVATTGPEGTFYFEVARAYGDNDPLDFYVPGVGGSTRIAFYLVLQQKGAKGSQGDTEYPDFRIFQPIEIVLQ